MNVILTTLNSKFIHTNLAIRYLKNYLKDIIPISLLEFNINQNKDFIVSEIYKNKPDVIGFSTYIWNFDETLRIAETIKIIMPNIKIILGGPEVSFDGEEVLKNNDFIDFVVYGEGEETFKELINEILLKRNNYKNIRGLIFRDDEMIFKNENRPLIKDLNSITSPYLEIGNEFENKIIYYESSRGCPFNCEFCLSSTIRGVRYFDIERVKQDITKFIKGKVKQVKFVDRTFNANKKYAMEIMKFIIDKDPIDINFHFEVTAHLLDEEMLEFLEDVKEGLFQFEVGVQSTNMDTVESIGRTTNFEKLRYVTKRIKSYNNIHQHLDLIAGLPYEGYYSFKKSFNDVYEIKPEKIQLGFLKLLKGSGLRLEESKYGYKYLDVSPYEVLENKYITYGELVKLKSIEDLVEKYYNEGYFEHSLEYIIKNFYNAAFDFYEDFSIYWEKMEYHKLSHSRIRLYEILIDYFDFKEFENNLIFREMVKYDYLLNNKKTTLPFGLIRFENDKVQRNLHDILKNQQLLLEYLYKYKDWPTKKLINKVTVEAFPIDVLQIIENGYNCTIEERKVYVLFDYKEGQLNRCESYDITEIIKEMI